MQSEEDRYPLESVVMLYPYSALLWTTAQDRSMTLSWIAPLYILAAFQLGLTFVLVTDAV